MLKQCVARLSLARPARHPAHRAHGRDDDEETADETCTGELHADRLCALRRGFVAGRRQWRDPVRRADPRRPGPAHHHGPAGGAGAGAAEKLRRQADRRQPALRRSGGEALGQAAGRADRGGDAGRPLEDPDRASAQRRRRSAGQRRRHRDQARAARPPGKRRGVPLHHREPPAARLGGGRGDQGDPLREPRRLQPARPQVAAGGIAAHHRACRRPGRFRHDQRASIPQCHRPRPRDAAQAVERRHHLVLRQLPPRRLSGPPGDHHRRARHHRAQAARGPVRLPDQAPSAARLDERRHVRRGDPPERRGQEAVRLGWRRRTADPLAGRLFRRPRPVSRDQPRAARP